MTLRRALLLGLAVGYEIALPRALERHGPPLTLEQLGAQWLDSNVGTRGSNEQARLNLARGVAASEAGHPHFNRLWFTISNQCRGDIFGRTVTVDLAAFGGREVDLRVDQTILVRDRVPGHASWRQLAVR